MPKRRTLISCDETMNAHGSRSMLRAWHASPNYRSRLARDVYKIAKKGVWLGTVEAPGKQGAIEKTAAEFKVDAWRLCAMERR